MEGISSGNEAGGAGGSSSYQALKRMDEQWLRMRSMKPGKPATYDPLPVSEAFAQVFETLNAACEQNPDVYH
jgi:hypothetical protein